MITACMAVLVSCSKWTEPTPADYSEKNFWETDPHAWAEHAASMRAYRDTDHRIVYTRLHNSPDGFTSEKDYMRCIPDSVDIISLTNADNLSSHDIEDLAVMKDLGIKVLYQIDWSGRSETDFAADGALESYIEKTIRSVKEHGLDGWAINGVYRYGDNKAAAAAKMMISRLSEIKTENQLIVLEGNPLFVPDERDRRKLDYVVLDSDTMKTISEVSLAATAAVRAGIKTKNLLVSAKVDGILTDLNLNEYEAMASVAEIIQKNSYGGIGVYGLSDDYASGYGNYSVTRRIITLLNP